jgi:hypothetical protein
LVAGTATWTTDKDQRLSEVGNRLHVLRFSIGSAEARPSMHGGPDLAKAKAELASLMEENKTLTEEFRGIQSRPHTVSKIMKWSGISMALVGIIAWYAANQAR